MAISKVPLPPMPSDPRVCRWCTALMVSVAGQYVCTTNGCTKADQPTWDGFCFDCRREFQTGSRWHTELCWQCTKREMDAQRASAMREPRPFGYEADRRAQGANRRAIDALHGTKPEPVNVSSTAEKVDTLDQHLREQQRRAS